MKKKYIIFTICIALILIIQIPIWAMYISTSIGNNAIKYQLKIEQGYVEKAANSPVLGKGMIPIIWNNQKWVVTSSDNNNWYDYTNQKWANIMMSDGDYIESSISTDEDKDGIDDLTNKKIAVEGDEIEETQLGSMFVWIPRYEYKINTELKSISVRYIGIDDSNSEGYVTHPVFQNGTENGHKNGEWDENITGFWFAKFEASKNDDETDIKILPNAASYNKISIQNAYTTVKAATFEMEDTVGLDVHLTKNSEWGAVAYLSWSNFGTSGKEVYMNNYFSRTSAPNSITGLAGFEVNAATTNSTANNIYRYNTTNGQKASTTYNIYGIYDMNGCTTEYIAATYEGSSVNSTDDGSKYITVYSAEYTPIGDAINETSGWNNNKAVMINSSSPFFMRGEPGSIGGTTDETGGIFAYNSSDGVSSNFRGFRACIVVE